jgi:hypothetical protein
VPANTVDGNLSTRWSAQGDGEWIRYDLSTATDVHFLKIAWYHGASRVATFDVQISADGVNWTNLLAGQASSGSTSSLETYDFADANGRYIRIVGHGNSSSNWNSILETEIWGMSTTPAPDKPVLTLTTPTADPVETGRKRRLKVSGTATDNLGVLRVEWRKKDASQWKATDYNATTKVWSDNIPVSRGTTVYEFRAVNFANSLSEVETLTVIRR